MQLQFGTAVAEFAEVDTFRVTIDSITETSPSSRRLLVAQLEVEYSILVPASMFLPLLLRCDSLPSLPPFPSLGSVYVCKYRL